MDFNEQAKKKYEELLAQKEKIDSEIKPLKKYLEMAGVLKKQTRKRKATQAS